MRERRLVVVGGGVAGLAAARVAGLEARGLGVPLSVTLLEAGPRLGGKVLTEHVDGVPLEWGPDSFLVSKPGALEVARALDLAGDLVAPGTGRAHLLLGGRLRPIPPGTVIGVPAGPGSLIAAVRSGVLSVGGAARALLEPVVPGTPSRGASVGEVARKRLGRQVAERLVSPLLGGVYGAHAGALGLDAIPQLSGGRSLMLAARRARRAGAAEVRAIRGGMGRLVERLRERVPGETRTGTAVVGLGPDGDAFRLATTSGEVAADAVVLAAPAGAAAIVLSGAAPGAAGPLGEVEYRGSVVVHLRWAEGALSRPMDAAGYLVAGGHGAVAACSWLNAKWPHLGLRGPRARAIVVDPVAMAAPDEELGGRVAEEAGRALGATAGPIDVRLHRWGEAMPVFAPGHRARVAAARAALPAGVALAGAAYDGIGLPDCIRSGEDAARRVVGFLAEGSA